MNKVKLGAHFSYLQDSQLLGTIQDAIKTDANSGAFYISKSRSYNKFPLNETSLNKAKELANKHEIKIEDFIVHAPLVGNLANIDPETGVFEKTFKSYLDDLITMEKSSLKYFNMHPGSCANKELGIKKIAEGVNNLHKQTLGHSTIILLETMVGKGNYIGRTFEELKEIIDLIKDKTRVGVCIDTCHVWDAGYDIKNNLEGVLNDFDKIIGLNYLKALHINDSKNELGSNKDRHEFIGEGKIGLEALNKFVNHPKLVNLPKALETPFVSDDLSKWKHEIEILRNNVL